MDIHVNCKSEKRLWNSEGFSGHHPKRLDKEGHRYEIEIRIPKKNIFKEEIDIEELLLELCIKDYGFASDQVRVEIVKYIYNG